MTSKFIGAFMIGLLLVQSALAFEFAVFGDNHGTPQVFIDLIAKLNQEKGLAFAVNVGDCVLSGQEKEYREYLNTLKTLKLKVYQTAGNHDMMKKGYLFFAKYCGPSYYSFDYENAHFVVLDNAFKNSFDAKQFNWLKNDLARTRQEHIFVFLHKPAFDPSEIYPDQIMSGTDTVRELMKVFSRYHVAYVFAGHIHGYARATRDNLTCIVTAGAGAPLYLPGDFGGFHHYVKVRVDGDAIIDKVVRVYD